MKCYIIVNGQKMTDAEFKKYAAERNAKSAKQPRKNHVYTTKDYIREISEQVDDMCHKLRILRSLESFYNNGYRQWGNSFKTVVSIEKIHKPLFGIVVTVNRMKPLVSEIETLGKRGSKGIFQDIEKLTYILQDIKVYMKNLYDGVKESEVLYGLSHRPCIYETGRRLGLQEIMYRMFTALNDIDKTIAAINSKL